jgi:hypothetical protein
MNSRSLLVACLATLGLAVAGWGQAGGKIAFISDREGHSDVWIMNADGSDPVTLTQGRDCASPAWSPWERMVRRSPILPAAKSG